MKMDLPEKVGKWIRKSNTSNVYFHSIRTNLMAIVNEQEIVFGTAIPCGAVFSRKKYSTPQEIEQLLKDFPL